MHYVLHSVCMMLKVKSETLLWTKRTVEMTKWKGKCWLMHAFHFGICGRCVHIRAYRSFSGCRKLIGLNMYSTIFSGPHSHCAFHLLFPFGVAGCIQFSKRFDDDVFCCFCFADAYQVSTRKEPWGKFWFKFQPRQSVFLCCRCWSCWKMQQVMSASSAKRCRFCRTSSDGHRWEQGFETHRIRRKSMVYSFFSQVIDKRNEKHLYESLLGSSIF